jgi:hypothetical protein
LCGSSISQIVARTTTARAVSSFEDRRLESLDLGASHPIREADTRRLVKGQRGGILRIVANNMMIYGDCR